VILARLAGLSPTQKAEVIAKVIHEYGNQLVNAFTVITPKKVKSRLLDSSIHLIDTPLLED
jgi:hypothetical protein